MNTLYIIICLKHLINFVVSNTRVIPILCWIYATFSFVDMLGSITFSARFYGLENDCQALWLCSHFEFNQMSGKQLSFFSEKCGSWSATYYMFISITGWCLKSCIFHETSRVGIMINSVKWVKSFSRACTLSTVDIKPSISWLWNFKVSSSPLCNYNICNRYLLNSNLTYNVTRIWLALHIWHKRSYHFPGGVYSRRKPKCITFTTRGRTSS